MPQTVAPFDAFNGTSMGEDVTYIFTYADAVTGGIASMVVCVAFFLVVFIGSLIYQQKFTSGIRPETSLLAASFVTLGFELILMQKTILNGWFFGITLAITILSFLWVVFGPD